MRGEPCIENSEFETLENFIDVMGMVKKDKEVYSRVENIGQLVYQSVSSEK